MKIILPLAIGVIGAVAAAAGAAGYYLLARPVEPHEVVQPKQDGKPKVIENSIGMEFR